MKKSEIKDLYNNSESALKVIKAMYLLLPYAKDVDELALKIAAQVQVLFPVVKTMCDYMIDDGSYNMNERLQEIDRELRQIERDVEKMGYSKKRFILCQNCRAIINNIKDVDMWGKEPQQKPNEGAGGELAGCEPKTLSEPTEKPIMNEQLPTIYDDEYNKAIEQHVFYNAITKGWMELKGNTYNWKRNQEYLALMCGLLYWGDKVKDNHGADTDSLGEYPKILLKSSDRFRYKSGETTKTSKDIKALFGGTDVSNLRSQLTELPDEFDSIVRLFPTG